MNQMEVRAKLLNPDDARVFRITHIDNVEWLLDNGLHCQSSHVRDPDFVPIGMPELISKRSSYPVPVAPGGVLADYVPFYFTPWSLMLLNIKTGRSGVIQRTNEEIVIVGARLRELVARGLGVVFTDGHACGLRTHETSFFNDLGDLTRIDWHLLQRRDFTRDPDDLGKQVRYMAEALVHRHLPVDAIGGIVCNSENVKKQIDAWTESRSVSLKVRVRPDWYF